MKVMLYLQFMNNDTQEGAYKYPDVPSVHAAHEILMQHDDVITCTIRTFANDGTISEQHTARKNRDGSIKGKSIVYYNL